jgi:hypothetical protein
VRATTAAPMSDEGALAVFTVGVDVHADFPGSRLTCRGSRTNRATPLTGRCTSHCGSRIFLTGRCTSHVGSRISLTRRCASRTCARTAAAEGRASPASRPLPSHKGRPRVRQTLPTPPERSPSPSLRQPPPARAFATERRSATLRREDGYPDRSTFTSGSQCSTDERDGHSTDADAPQPQLAKPNTRLRTNARMMELYAKLMTACSSTSRRICGLDTQTSDT